MIERLAALIVDEGKWLPLAMTLAIVAVVSLVYRHRRADVPPRRLVAAAMNLLLGVMMATMACGHVLAVTTKAALNTLEGSLPLLYAIGIALLLPSGFVIRHAARMIGPGDHGRATVTLNAWLAATLLALGVVNAPLAAPALLNIAYQLHSRRAVGWAIVATAVIVNGALFIGSVIFMASGQSFEQFSGMQ